MKTRRALATTFASLLIVLLVMLAPPAQPALAYGALINAVRKASNEMLQDSSSWAGRAWRSLSGEASQEIMVRATTRYVAPRVESISELLKDSPRLQTPADQDEYARLKVPRGVDLRYLANPVTDQGAEGTCTAFALAGAMEIAIAARYSRVVKLSERHIWSFYRRPQMRQALHALTGKWIATNDIWPYNRRGPYRAYTSRAAAFPSTPTWIPLKDAQSAIKALAQNKPLFFGTDVTRSFDREFGTGSHNDGVIPFPPSAEHSTGGHAMTIVGYQIDRRFAGGGYFILRNSWGRAWGAQGYGYLPFAWCKRYECSAYVLDDVTWDDTGRTINVVTGEGAS
jgi:hypothetical protein